MKYKPAKLMFTVSLICSRRAIAVVVMVIQAQGIIQKIIFVQQFSKILKFAKAYACKIIATQVSFEQHLNKFVQQTATRTQLNYALKHPAIRLNQVNVQAHSQIRPTFCFKKSYMITKNYVITTYTHLPDGQSPQSARTVAPIFLILSPNHWLRILRLRSNAPALKRLG